LDKSDGAVDLATAIVKSACTLWAGPFGPISAGILELVNTKVAGRLQQRKAERFFNNCIDVIAEQLLDLIDRSGRKVDDSEVIPAIYAVRDTFDSARITLTSLIKADIDARLLEKEMAQSRARVLSRALLNDSGQHYYDLLLRESSAYAVELISTLPDYDVEAFRELLKRDTAILDNLRTVLARLPDRRSVDDFDADYRRIVIRRLDRMQLFGAKLQSDLGRRYPLSVAYVSLGAASPGASSSEIPGKQTKKQRAAQSASQVSIKERVRLSRGSRHNKTDTMTDWAQESHSWGTPTARVAADPIVIPTTHRFESTIEHTSVAGDLPVEHWLSGRKRVILTGEAGSGKSTLLQWLAVRAARKDFDDELKAWNALTPFFIPLRRYAAGLPNPEEFPKSIGKNITEEMPPGWVQSCLRRGQGLVLIDGLDELKEGEQRAEALQWLRDLTEDFPLATYIITTRPAALKYGHALTADFTSLELRPMTPAKVRTFVEHWHEAMRIELTDQEEREALVADQSAFLSALENDRHVRALCVNPLLCALLSALNRDRHGHLPKDRMGVYAGALEMLLDARDQERGIRPTLKLSHDAKVTLLQDLALYLVRNGWSDAPVERVQEQLARSARSLSEIDSTSEMILQFLLERSGLIRTPSEGRIDFIHRTFQEYLAGKAAVDDDEIGYLLKHATDDQFWDVIVMAMGHALPWQAEEFLRQLLTQATAHKAWSTGKKELNRLKLLAVACLQTTRRLDPDLRGSIDSLVAELLPPESFEVAPVLAAAGPIVLDLMAERSANLTTAQAAASIRVASLIGGHDAMLLISDIAGQYKNVEDEAIRAWTEFDLADYASVVIPRLQWSGRLTVTDESVLALLPGMNGLIELTVPSRILSNPHVPFPRRPEKVRCLRITGDGLRQLDRLTGWDDLAHLEVHLSGLGANLAAISKFRHLEGLRIVSNASGSLDLGPLNKMRNLKVLQLAIPKASFIRLNPLSDVDNLVLYIPSQITIVGRDTLKSRSQVKVEDAFPRFP
jgi:hypothetical protein